MSSHEADDTVDFGALFDEHMADEFDLQSPEATMTTMTQDPVVLHVPTSIGGRGQADVVRFYSDFFIGTFPDDLEVVQVSRTIGDTRLVEEMILTFTHDREIPAFLPGVAPTGRRVELPLVAIVGFADGKVSSEHLYWDQATVLAQTGLLDAEQVPALGAQQAATLRADTPSNELLAGW